MNQTIFSWATLVLASMFAGCTFVSIEGDNNSVSDTGGHGGVTLPPNQPTLSDQLQRLHNAAQGQQ